MESGGVGVLREVWKVVESVSCGRCGSWWSLCVAGGVESGGVCMLGQVWIVVESACFGGTWQVVGSVCFGGPGCGK